MATYKPVDPVSRGEEYRKAGWSTFDDKAPPYRPNEAEIDPDKGQLAGLTSAREDDGRVALIGCSPFSL